MVSDEVAALWDAGRYEEALALAGSATSAEDAYAVSRVLEARANEKTPGPEHREQAIAQAVALARHASVYPSRRALVQCRLAQWYEREQRWSEAEPWFRKAVDELEALGKPAYELAQNAFIGLAGFLERRRQFEDAAREWERMLQFNRRYSKRLTQQSQPLTELVDCFEAAGRLDEAVRWMREYLAVSEKLDRADYVAQSTGRLASLLARAQRPDEALNALGVAFRKMPAADREFLLDDAVTVGEQLVAAQDEARLRRLVQLVRASTKATNDELDGWEGHGTAGQRS